MAKFNTVDDYINSQAVGIKEALFILKDCILKAAPEAKELFNYGIPAFALVENGKREEQIMIAGYKKHVGFYPHPTTIEKFSEKLTMYKQGKGSIQFPINTSIPCELIIEMVKYRKSLIKDDKKYGLSRWIMGYLVSLEYHKKLKEFLVINKNEIISNICYTSLVYGRINKKLGKTLTDREIENFMIEVLTKTPENEYEKAGNNFYVSNKNYRVRITINSNILTESRK